MTNATKTRAVTGLASLVSGAMLVGTSGPTFVVGWIMWAGAVGALLAATPAEDGPRRRRRVRGGRGVRVRLLPGR